MRRYLLLLLAASLLPAITENERIRNPHVTATEYTLAPGEVLAMESKPAVTVYFDGGTLAGGSEFDDKKRTVERGEAVFTPAGPQTIRNAGSSHIHFVRIELPGSPSKETWGSAGLPPNYKLLFENSFTRVYDIRIPAHSDEKQHTHHDRVVVCLSGAKLRHEMPDGREETATLETGEIAWRRGATHIGHNLGDTPLWVIAVEPK
jgi:quercetin dioxygenase-like cupin family protein